MATCTAKEWQTLPDLAAALDPPVAPETLHRWRKEGLLASDGRRVKLKTRRQGGRHYATREDVAAFLDEVNGETG